MEPAQIVKRNDLKMNNYKSGISFLSVAVTLMLIFVAIFSFPLLEVTASDVVFTNASTAESEISAYIQTKLDGMSSEIVIRTKGLEIAKLFLETDSDGEFLEPLEATGLHVNLFYDQIKNLNPTYYNSYTYLAMSGWSYPDRPSVLYTKEGNSIKSIDIIIEYKIYWRDGTNAFDNRNDVANHAINFLESTEYRSKTTDDEKLKAINEYISETFQYDYRLFVEEEMDDVIYSAYQMINDTEIIDGHPIGGYPRGVCQAYAMYGYIMLREAGYEVITIEGNKDPGSGLNTHVWNLVKVGSYWYHIDFTWNDPISYDVEEPIEFIKYRKRQDGKGIVSLNNFLRSDEEMRKNNHDWDESLYPAATQKWSGNPEIIEETPPPPAPPIATPTPTPSPTPTLVPTQSITPTIPPSSSQSSSGSDESIQSESENESEISKDNSQSKGNESSSILPTPTLVPINMITSNNSEDYKLNSTEKTVTISGFLYDASGEVVSGMLVELFATSMTRRTNSKGYFEFKGVKIGNYKIYVKDNQGNEIAEMPVVISFGDITEYDSGEITVRGGRLDMNLVLDGDKLSIQCVSSPKFAFTVPLVVGIIAVLILLLAAFAAIVLHKKDKVGVSEYLE